MVMDAKMSIKEYLKSVGVSKQEFASEIKLSRPTLDSYIDMYEKSGRIPRERYQIIFDNLFREELTEVEFKEKLKKMHRLLVRDTRLGTEKLDARAADEVARLKNRMLRDMSEKDWNPSVYSFMEMLLDNYRRDAIFRRLAEYFVFLNRSETSVQATEEQKPYFVNFYKTFDSLYKNEQMAFDAKDYDLLIQRRDRLAEDRKEKRDQRKDELMKLLSSAVKEMGADATDAEIMRAVFEKLQTK